MHSDKQSWNWEENRREVANLNALKAQLDEAVQPYFPTYQEFFASPDGERIAASVRRSEGAFGIWDSGEFWDGEFEKAWHLRYTPDGRLLALVRVDDMWSVVVDGTSWRNQFEFAWNPKCCDDGSAIGVQVKQDMQYTVAVNDRVWEQRFLSCRDFALSGDGRHAAAVVQVEEVPEADIFKFAEGTWSVAVDQKAWERRFINVYRPVFSPDGVHVAAEVRTDICEYTVAQDQRPWDARFGCVWEPCYRADGSGLLAPVRQDGAWTLAENGSPIWNGRYMQLWHVMLGPAEKQVAAVAAPSYGRWTVAVDDVPWPVTFGDLVAPPVFSPDGRRIAAAVRDNNRWSVAVDGRAWDTTFDRAWDPVFSPDGSVVAARVICGAHYALAIDGRLCEGRFDALWDPVFSPQGDRILLRAVEKDTYVRRVVVLETIRA